MRAPYDFEVCALVAFVSYVISSTTRFYIIEMFITYPLMGAVFYSFPKKLLGEDTPEWIYSALSATSSLLFVGIGYHWFADSAHDNLGHISAPVEEYLFFNDEIMSHGIMLIAIFSYITILSLAYVKWPGDFQLIPLYKIFSLPAGIGFGMMVMEIDAPLVLHCSVLGYAAVFILLAIKHGKQENFLLAEVLFFVGVTMYLAIAIGIRFI